MMIKVGQILTTYGHKGEVKIFPLTDNPERFKKLKYVFLQLPDGMKKVHIEKVRVHNNLVFIKFTEVPDMTAAEKLRGLYITIEEEQLVDLPEDHYFLFQIIGLDVYENDLYLGKITDVVQTGSNDVYIVKNNQKEILIPALKSIIKVIDLKEKKMSVSLPEGLLE
ncbi:MAG: 16S rRNA processing protein RimM [Clostridia bacterium]|nr:16S rRNA processing protein RimM [Clostridia bacterium]